MKIMRMLYKGFNLIIPREIATSTLAATGCVGKNPVVLVWETDFAPEHGQNAVAVIGEGFFYRGVCAVQFSWDKKHIIGISCDDYHQIGIFSLTTGKLICQAPGQHGIPPQIRWLAYCPAQQHVQFITREHSGLCDMFATAGVNHLKIWSFKRPAYTAMSLGGQDADDASLVSRGCTVGKSTSLPKCFSCCGFVPCDNGDYDFCAGASNGFVYMWKIGNLVAHQQVIKGGRVQCLEVKGSRIFCGGAGGNLVVIDARTLRPLMSFSLLSSQPSPRGSTAKSGGRPSSMNKRPQSAPRPGMSRGKTNAGQQQKAADDSTTGPTEESGALVITGLVVVQPGGATSRDKMMAGSTYVIASLGTGKTVRVEIGAAKPLQNNFMVSNPKEKKQPSNIISNAPDPGQEKGPPPAGRDLFYFHTGPVYGLAADVTSNCKYIATVGDDRKLFLWDVRTKSGLKLAGCAVLQTPARCCHLDKFNSFIAVGMTNGAFSVYFRSDHIYPSVFQPSANANPRGGAASKNEVHVLYEVGFRKDSKLEITEIKFSPSNEILATGGRDDTICVYKCELAVESQGFGREMRDVGTCLLQPLHRMRGHSSSITHLDWSYDSKLILSTSAAYELLCWDVDAGRQFNKVNVSDIKWKTNHCILGFSVMGIWPPYSDGTDVNALDVSHEKNLVITANDQDGLVKLFNYPCVVKNPPERTYTGHSSHVSNIKFLKGADFAISVGGNDRSVVLWEVIPARDLKRVKDPHNAAFAEDRRDFYDGVKNPKNEDYENAL